MSTAKMTLIGLYNYDSTLFDNLSVPNGIDKSTLINNILLNGGEFEVLYSNPEFLKLAVGMWSQKWQHTMVRWVKLLGVDYDPLNNYDRHEEYTDVRTNTGSSNVTNTGSATDTSKNTFTGTTEGKVSAFDSSEYQPHDHTTAGNTTNASVTNSSNSTSEGTTSSDENMTHDAHLYGNIGVTSSQELWTAEKDVLKINMYDELANLFLAEFVVPVY